MVDESFRQYAIEWGMPRVGRLFKEQGVPLSIALNAEFPQKHADVWKRLRASVPHAPIVAHGMNNSTELLPLKSSLDAQKNLHSPYTRQGTIPDTVQTPEDLERMWIEYVTELAREAEADPDRGATIVAIGIHPFIVGTPDGAASLRRVLENFKSQKLVWITNVEALLRAAGKTL
ncbi:MAG: hypothetical protein K9G48_14820 [Reyranella sp.]|nr:hypothetical protein [Reyranella sp.]